MYGTKQSCKCTEEYRNKRGAATDLKEITILKENMKRHSRRTDTDNSETMSIRKRIKKGHRKTNS
jgi:hypothetical protein